MFDYLYDLTAPSFKWGDVLEHLTDQGFVVLRNVFPKITYETVYQRVKHVMSGPALGGSYGYYRKDYAKKLFDPLLLSGPTVDLMLNESVIDLIEEYVKGEVVLAECNIKHDDGVNHLYFPVHTDLMLGWTVENSGVVLTEEDLKSPIAVGAMIYFHDTATGAFCYAAGTHKIPKTQHGDLKDYPEQLQKEVMEKMVRVDGQAGDLVLFDDRGFHGPEQPVTVSRTVLIFDYYKLETFGHKSKAPIPVIINDLSHLNAKQLHVLGLGVEAMIPYELYHTRSYNKSPYYKKMSRLFERNFKRKKHLISMKNRMRVLKRKLF